MESRTPLFFSLAALLCSATLLAQDPAPSTIWQSTGNSDFVGLGSKLRATSDLNQDGVGDFLSVAPNGDLNGLARTGVLTAISGADGSQLWQYAGWVDHQLIGRYMAYPHDLDGDLADDFLIGEPDVNANGRVENGRVTAIRGSDGTILWQILGASDHARIGESMTTLADLDGDGFSDLLFSMPGASTGLLFHNGSIMAVSGAWGSPLWIADGAANDESFGSQVAVTADLNGDLVADLVSLAPDASSGVLYQNGICSAVSAATGAVLWRRDGIGSFEHMAQVSKASEDINADGILDLLLRAPGGSTAGFFNNGWAEMVDGSNGTPLWHVDGAAHDMNFAADSVKIGDIDLDGLADFVLSAPGASSLGMVENGRVEAFASASGASLWATQGAVNYGRLGTNLLGMEDLNADGFGDLLTGLSTGATLGHTDNGYLEVLNSMTGGILWRRDGTLNGELLGSTILTVADFSGDGVQDLVLGAHNADLGGMFDNGEIIGVDGTNGSTVWFANGTESQELLGKDITTFTDMNGDGLMDLLAFSPFSNTHGLRDNGLVKAFSMVDGSVIWRHDGGRDGDRAGSARVLSDDHDHDGVADLVLGGGIGDYGAYRGNGVVLTLSAGRIQSLDILNLVGGGTASFQGSGFTPGSVVSVYASLVGPGPYQVLPGLVVALSPPLFTLGNAVADSVGTTNLSLAVPSSVSGRTVWFQAVQDFGSVFTNSNQLQMTVQ